jgi:hypothetical protein
VRGTRRREKMTRRDRRSVKFDGVLREEEVVGANICLDNVRVRPSEVTI